MSDYVLQMWCGAGRRRVGEPADWVRMFSTEARAVESAETDVTPIADGFARLYEVGHAMSHPRMVGEWEISDGVSRRVA